MKSSQNLFSGLTLILGVVLTASTVWAERPEIFKASAKGTLGRYAEEIQIAADSRPVSAVEEAVDQTLQVADEVAVDAVEAMKKSAKPFQKLSATEDSKPKESASELMAAADPEQAAMMKKWQAYATPNENHEVLGQMVGEWDHETKWWMSPDQEPDVSTGKSEISWILGQRYIQHDVEGKSMGMPFTGIGITGYDNGKQVYNSIWMDSMSTGMMKGKGQYNPDSNTLTEEGIYTCPLEGQKSYRSVTTFIDDDHFRFEMFTTMMGSSDEYRSMEISYTRKK